MVCKCVSLSYNGIDSPGKHCDLLDGCNYLYNKLEMDKLGPSVLLPFIYSLFPLLPSVSIWLLINLYEPCTRFNVSNSLVSFQFQFLFLTSL